MFLHFLRGGPADFPIGAGTIHGRMPTPSGNVPLHQTFGAAFPQLAGDQRSVVFQYVQVRAIRLVAWVNA